MFKYSCLFHNPTPFADMQPHIINEPPPCLTFHHTICSPSDPNSQILSRHKKSSNLAKKIINRRTFVNCSGIYILPFGHQLFCFSFLCTEFSFIITVRLNFHFEDVTLPHFLICRKEYYLQ